MGGSAGKSDNESESFGRYQQEVAPFQVPYLQQLWNRAGNLFGSSLGGIQGAQPGVSNQLSNIYGQMAPAWQQQLRGGAYSNIDPNRIISGIERSLESPSQMGRLNEMIMGGQGNTYLGGMQDMLLEQSADRQAQGLRGLDQRAAAAGMGGSSPYRNLQRDVISDEADRLADVQTRLGYNTFDRDLGLKMDIARQADAANLTRQQMLTNMLGQQQSAMSGGLNFGQNMAGQAMGQFAPYMAPWQAMGQYANVLGNPLVLGRGSFSGNASGKSLSGGLFG